MPDERIPADIGTDHAFLPAYLVATGRCPRAIASDDKPGPLEAARRTLEELGLSRSVDLRLGYGLSVLAPGEAEVIILAGMGGETIIDILKRGGEVAASCPQFILQPMQQAPRLRRWLSEHGYRIQTEELVQERDRIYEVLLVEQGAEVIEDDLLFEVGPRLWEARPPLFHNFLSQKIAQVEEALQKLERRGFRSDQAYWRLQKKLRRLENMRSELV